MIPLPPGVVQIVLPVSTRAVGKSFIVTVQVPDETSGVVLQVLSFAYLLYEVAVVSGPAGV